SGRNAAQTTEPGAGGIASIAGGDSLFQITIEPSTPTDENKAPSGRNAIDWTMQVCPMNVSRAAGRVAGWNGSQRQVAAATDAPENSPDGGVANDQKNGRANFNKPISPQILRSRERVRPGEQID